jgi:hypothetical protein
LPIVILQGIPLSAKKLGHALQNPVRVSREVSFVAGPSGGRISEETEVLKLFCFVFCFK